MASGGNIEGVTGVAQLAEQRLPGAAAGGKLAAVEQNGFQGQSV
jgi:hypothetical protein